MSWNHPAARRFYQPACISKWGLSSILLGLLLLQACSPATATPPDPSIPTRTLQPGITTSSPTVPVASATILPQAAPTLIFTPQPSETPVCSQDACVYPGHFALDRPIQGDPYDLVDPTYRYGSTEHGQREPHRGVEFQAPAGDPVLAAAGGVVFAAIPEGETPPPGIGNGYGNLLIVEHHFAGIPQPVYTVYGHLAQFDVTSGQAVKAGDVVGRVGETGAATGPHLHFEVRFGSDQVTDTRNPELWLRPAKGYPSGVIAGRIQTPDGQLVAVDTVSIQPIDSKTGRLGSSADYAETYASSAFLGDDTWQENYALGDLPPATYRVAFIHAGKMYAAVGSVTSGSLTVINFTVDAP